MFRKSNFLTTRVAYFLLHIFFSFFTSLPSLLFSDSSSRSPCSSPRRRWSRISPCPKTLFPEWRTENSAAEEIYNKPSAACPFPLFLSFFFFLRIDKALPPRRNLIPTISPTCCPRTRTIALSSSFFLSYSSVLSLSLFSSFFRDEKSLGRRFLGTDFYEDTSYGVSTWLRSLTRRHFHVSRPKVGCDVRHGKFSPAQFLRLVKFSASCFTPLRSAFRAVTWKLARQSIKP